MLRVLFVVAVALASCKPRSTAAPDQPRKGSLEKEIIGKEVRANLYRVQACYLGALARDPDTRGRVTLQFTIGPSGVVTAAAVVANETADEKVGECIAASAQRWRFPAPKGGGNVVVTYPFVLQPGSEAQPEDVLDDDAIREVVGAKLRFVVACYEAGLSVDEHARGRVTLQFTIGPTGEVTAAEILDDEILDKEVSECIADSTKRWKFPPPKGGRSVVVKHAFDLDTEPPDEPLPRRSRSRRR